MKIETEAKTERNGTEARPTECKFCITVRNEKQAECLEVLEKRFQNYGLYYTNFWGSKRICSKQAVMEAVISEIRMGEKIPPSVEQFYRMVENACAMLPELEAKTQTFESFMEWAKTLPDSFTLKIRE